MAWWIANRWLLHLRCNDIFGGPAQGWIFSSDAVGFWNSAFLRRTGRKRKVNSWPDRSSGKLSRTRTHFRLIEIWIEPPNFFLFQQVSSTHKHYVAMWMFFKYRHSWSWDSDHMVSMDWILMTLQWMDSYWSTSPKNYPRDPDSTNKLP